VNTPRPLPFAAFSFIDLSEGAVNYLWDFGDGGSSTEANPIHDYTAPGEYTVTLIVTDEHGCSFTLRKEPFIVIAPDLFIPNVFTPNNDGINDAYLVTYTGEESFDIKIFDRWGVQVFEENDPSRGWSGMLPSGDNSSEGVYFYSVKIGVKVYQGNLTLLR
jgi:gliding motility-associated-like protein